VLVENVKNPIFYETIYSSKYWCEQCQNVLWVWILDLSQLMILAEVTLAQAYTLT
jgi:hypothetical protein